MVCKKCSVYFATQVACKAHRCVFDKEDKYLDETELLAEINGGPLGMPINEPNGHFRPRAGSGNRSRGN